MVKFKFISFDDNSKTNRIYCCCSFCKGKKQRKEVKHFKTFAKGIEYYLNLNLKTGEGELIEKY